MAEEQEQPIVIKKIIKKGGHGGHHGGAWKVAYADFVTAMMCMFLLLWLVNSDPSVKSVIAEYFKQPTQTGPMNGNVFIFGGAKRPGQPGKLEGGASFLEFQKIVLTGQNKKEIAELIKRDLKAELEATADEDLFDRVKFSLVKKGILVEIKDLENQPMFEKGSSYLTPAATKILDKLGLSLRRKSAPIIISGHTDSSNFGFGSYDNWSLSSDRANAVRKRLIYSGVTEDRVLRIEGLSDTQPKVPSDPSSPLNRRITILLIQEEEVKNVKPQYLNPDDEFDFIDGERAVESTIKRAGSLNIKENSIAGKSHKAPSLEDLRRRKKRKAYYEKHPVSTSSGGHGGGAEEEAPAEDSGGGHGGGH